MGNQYSYKAVQQALIAYSVQHGTYASVGEVFPLMETSAVQEEISAAPEPSLYDWDLSDPRELLALYDHFHLGPEVVSTDVAYRISPDVYRAPVRTDIFVFLHLSHHRPELRKKDVIEFCYVLAGGATLFQQGGAYPLAAGDFALIGPENIHDIAAEPGGVALGIQLSRQRFTDGQLRFMRENNALVHLLSRLLYEDRSGFHVLCAPPDVEIKRVIRALLGEFSPLKAEAAAICTDLFEILLYKLPRICEGADEAAARSGERAFSAAMNEIYQRRSVSLRELSERFHYSQSHLSRLIRAKSGRTFNELVAEVRLGRARELLEHTELSMAEIAERAGYPSQNQFSRSFRECTGRTPTEYRLECQKSEK